jgi:hypothetical protein
MSGMADVTSITGVTYTGAFRAGCLSEATVWRTRDGDGATATLRHRLAATVNAA